MDDLTCRFGDIALDLVLVHNLTLLSKKKVVSVLILKWTNYRSGFRKISTLNTLLISFFDFIVLYFIL